MKKTDFQKKKGSFLFFISNCSGIAFLIHFLLLSLFSGLAVYVQQKVILN